MTLILAMLLLALPFAIAEDTVVSAEASDTVSEDTAAAKSADTAGAQTHLVKMDSTITYATGVGIKTEELKLIRDNFAAEITKLGAAADKATIESQRSALQDLAKQFKDKAAELGIGKYKSEVVKQAKLDVDKKKATLDTYAKKAADARKTAILNHANKLIEQANKAVAKLKEKGIDTAAVELKIAELSTLKLELTSSLDSGNKDTIRAAVKKVSDKWKEIKDAFKTASQNKRIATVITNAEKAGQIASAGIQKIKARGVDTAALESKLAAYNAKVEVAKTANAEGNLPAAIQALKELKVEAGDLRTATQTVRTEARQLIQSKVKATGVNTAAGGASQ